MAKREMWTNEKIEKLKYLAEIKRLSDKELAIEFNKSSASIIQTKIRYGIKGGTTSLWRYEETSMLKKLFHEEKTIEEIEEKIKTKNKKMILEKIEKLKLKRENDSIIWDFDTYQYLILKLLKFGDINLASRKLKMSKNLIVTTVKSFREVFPTALKTDTDRRKLERILRC